MANVIGIDLGTTNSCVAVVEGGQPAVIPNRGGYRTTPSMVAFTDDGKRLIGHMAKRQLLTNPKNTIYASKRLIGRRYDSPEVKRAKAYYPFEITTSPNGDIRLQVAEKQLSLPEVGAMILQEMKHVAEDHLGEDVTQAVITVPAFFNDAQRQATKDAGRIAGLDVLRIINEPTAAALAYGRGRSEEETLAIYDLGGGTFDITILSMSDGIYEVLATSGDTYLGGDDFDDRIIDFLAEMFLEKEKIDLRRDRMALQRLKDAAEKAKCDLSTSQQVQINLPFIAHDESGPKHLEVGLERSAFETMTDDLVERTFQICERATQDAEIDRSEIDQVILVGGQTRMPLVQKRVEDFFGKAPRKGVHPDEVVAVGAAIQGDTLVSADSDVVLLDVTPLSLGIATFGGFFTRLIERNTTIPVRKSHIFTTAADNQTAVKIHVLQGESSKAAENELLGEFMLTGIRQAPRGEPEIEVTFEIDSDGIVGVSAKDLDTGQTQSITVTASSGLSEEEIQSMMDDSQNYAVELKGAADVSSAAHELEEAVLKLEKALKEKENAIPAGMASKSRDLAGMAREALARKDMNSIRSLTEEVTSVLHRLP